MNKRAQNPKPKNMLKTKLAGGAKASQPVLWETGDFLPTHTQAECGQLWEATRIDSAPITVHFISQWRNGGQEMEDDEVISKRKMEQFVLP